MKEITFRIKNSEGQVIVDQELEVRKANLFPGSSPLHNHITFFSHFLSHFQLDIPPHLTLPFSSLFFQALSPFFIPEEKKFLGKDFFALPSDEVLKFSGPLGRKWRSHSTRLDTKKGAIFAWLSTKSWLQSAGESDDERQGRGPMERKITPWGGNSSRTLLHERRRKRRSKRKRKRKRRSKRRSRYCEIRTWPEVNANSRVYNARARSTFHSRYYKKRGFLRPSFTWCSRQLDGCGSCFSMTKRAQKGYTEQHHIPLHNFRRIYRLMHFCCRNSKNFLCKETFFSVFITPFVRNTGSPTPLLPFFRFCIGKLASGTEWLQLP